MTKAELLSEVKIALGNVPSHLENTIQSYINEVINYMISAGVSSDLLDMTTTWNIDNRCVGCIVRGVADLWNYGSSDTKLSEYFYQRCSQLTNLEVEDDGI